MEYVVSGFIIFLFLSVVFCFVTGTYYFIRAERLRSLAIKKFYEDKHV